jgi:ATP-dependent DNA helicase RecG
MEPVRFPNADRLAALLPHLRRPLVLAARQNFAHADRVKGIDHAILGRLAGLELGDAPKAIQDKLDKLKDQVDGLDAANETHRKARILAALSLLDGLETLLRRDDPDSGANDLPGAMEFVDRRPLYMSVQFLKGVGPKGAEYLAQKDLITVEDLLYYLPRRWDDRRRVGRIADLQVGEFGQTEGEIVAMSVSAARFRKQPYEVVIQDESGSLALSWFHYGAQHIPKKFAVGDRVRVGGRVGLYRNRRQIVHPEMELVAEAESDEDGLSLLGNIRPVYSEIQNFNSRKLAGIIQQAVQRYGGLIDEPLPENIRTEAALPGLAECVRHLHLPGDESDVDLLNSGRSPWHKRLAFDELFFVQLGLARLRRGVKQQEGVAHKRLNRLATAFYKRFPHSLTGAQKRVLQEIVEDLTSPKPMNRLLQGDVGSGKTIVAALAALLVVENGRQVALMAPTEILAEQHYQSIASLCGGLEGVTVSLLTGDLARAGKQAIIDGIGQGDINFVIGTHALIQKGVEFNDLGFVIIDEQHRFGVEQRAILAQKGKRPDCLVMTATPIPRSLSLTVYGDLDVSIIDELPPGREPVETQVMWMSETARAHKRIEQEIRAGRQVYVVAPLVSESEKMDLANAEGVCQELIGRFPDFTVGLLHGRMSGTDKETVMHAFKDGHYDILVATSVIEVGVDVSNATLMVVLHAERFGLSQLHQLRGRVGRGAHASSCLLLVEKLSEDGRERVGVMEQTTDGFKIAEKDLEIRGPGDFLGTRQTGVPLFTHANLVRDQDVLAVARRIAFAWIERDPDLQTPEAAAMRAVFESRYRDKLKLIGIG